MSEILRYRISDWPQIKDCLSNNSASLHAYATTFMIGSRLSGHQVVVEDDAAGVLFAAMIDGSGYYMSEMDPDGHAIPFLSYQDVLNELARFGFIIEYAPEEHLPQSQIDIIKSCQQLGCDYLLRLCVVSGKDNVINSHIVAMNSGSRCGTDWLSYGATISEKEYAYLLSSGAAVDLERFRIESDWSWLTSLRPISSILDANEGE